MKSSSMRIQKGSYWSENKWPTNLYTYADTHIYIYMLTLLQAISVGLTLEYTELIKSIDGR